MKLFICPKCGDVRAPRPQTKGKTFCLCGLSWARVRPGKTIESCFTMTIGGEAIPFAICVNHLRWGIQNYLYDKRTSFVHAYIIDPTQKINDVKIERKKKDATTKQPSADRADQTRVAGS